MIFDDVEEFFIEECPEYVFHCAGTVGGISKAIKYPSRMLSDNIRMGIHVLGHAATFGTKKLLNLGSSCIYPVAGEQPYREEQLGTGKTDENWSYAIAKIAVIEYARALHKEHGKNFITAIPCNLYGINDNFGDNGHVIPMLIRKFSEHNGEPIKIWGDGTQFREFLYSDDFAECAVWLMETWEYEDLYDGVVNVGSGKQISINILRRIIGKIILNDDYDYYYTANRPSGIQSKLMDDAIITHLGWYPKTSLKEGIEKTYSWYKENHATNVYY